MKQGKPSKVLMPVLLAFVGISGAFSVLFGAWLAHAGQALANEDFLRLTYAHQYQFIHTIVLFIVVLAHTKQPALVLRIAAIGFALGIVLFSGSLYLKTFLGVVVLGSLAPFGGIILAIAWLSLTFFSVNKLGEQTS